MRALVCFQDASAHWAARFLKPGFQHVWVVVANDGVWMMLDPKMGTPVLHAITNDSFDLASFYREQGLHVVEVETREIEHFWPLMLNNCVAVVKLIIGLRAPFIWTPWQLYRRLMAIADPRDDYNLRGPRESA